MSVAKPQKIIKNVTFDYYTISFSEDLLEKTIQKCNKEYSSSKARKKYSKYKENLEKLLKSESIFDFEDILKKVNDGILVSRFMIANKTVDIDLKTFVENDEYIFFQIANNRSFNIPSRREIGGERKSIMLKDNEYIGEFLSILYHKKTKVFMVQRNRYSLSRLQLTKVLSQLFNDYNVKVKNINTPYIMLELRPILDNERLNKINKNNIIDKVTLSGTSVSLAKLSSDKQRATHFLVECLKAYQAYGFTLILTANVKGIKNSSMKNDEVIKLVSDLSKLSKDESYKDTDGDLDLEVGVRENETAKRELIDYLVPSISQEISFEMKERTALSYEIIKDKMLKAFEEKKDELTAILGLIL